MYQFLVDPDGSTAPGEYWSTLWAQILSKALVKESQVFKTIAESAPHGAPQSSLDADARLHDWEKMLPPASKVMKGRSLVKDTSAVPAVTVTPTGPAATEGPSQIKNEEVPEHASGGSMEIAPDMLTFNNVYDVNNETSAIDILAVGLEIQNYLFRKAAVREP